MTRQSALERLLLQQVQLAHQGDRSAEDVQRQLLDFAALAHDRTGTAFLFGYASVLLPVPLQAMASDARWSRWHHFGQLRAHHHKGDREAIAQALQSPQTLIELLSDRELAAQALPFVVPVLFWCGNLQQALRAIQYLAADRSTREVQLVVDAAITDLLARLEARTETADAESTASILAKVLQLPGFERLPVDVRARYQKALADRLLSSSEWAAADQHARAAAALAPTQPLRSATAAVRALALLRMHSAEELEPRASRTERAAVRELLSLGGVEASEACPQARFILALLDYEGGDYAVAAAGFEHALGGLKKVGASAAALSDRAHFFQAAALLAEGRPEESSRALRLMAKALDTVRPDLESFYSVHEALKKLDRKLALLFLDRVDIGRGTSPDQLLFVALEYASLGEAAPASFAARRVLEVAVDLDQRLEALRVVLTAHNMQGESEQARACYAEMRELLLQRGAFEQLERLLKNETAVGQALDHVEIKCELAALYEEMEGREYERAHLQIAIARSMRARKEVESLRQAHGLLQEVAIHFPELAQEDLVALEKVLEANDAAPPDQDQGRAAIAALARRLGHKPRVLVVGGNERQRKHHPRLQELAQQWGFDADWVMTNYTSPQKVVAEVHDHLQAGVDIMMMLHWNRHETTEPALELARKHGVAGRTVHYAGFTSLQVALSELLEKMTQARDDQTADQA